MIAVPIRSRRSQRGQFAQKLQHAIPSIVVLGDGVNHLTHNAQGLDLALAIAEIGAAVLVIGSVIRGFRHLRKTVSTIDDAHAHHGIDWIDVCLGVMLSVEAYAKYHANPNLPRPTLLLAVTMLTVGFNHGRLAAWGDRRRQLRVSPEGISVPGKFFSRSTWSWREVASIEIGDKWAIVTSITGRRKRINLNDMVHAQAVRDTLMAGNTFLDEARHAASASIESTATRA